MKMNMGGRLQFDCCTIQIAILFVPRPAVCGETVCLMHYTWILCVCWLLRVGLADCWDFRFLFSLNFVLYGKTNWKKDYYYFYTYIRLKRREAIYIFVLLQSSQSTVHSTYLAWNDGLCVNMYSQRAILSLIVFIAYYWKQCLHTCMVDT